MQCCTRNIPSSSSSSSSASGAGGLAGGCCSCCRRPIIRCRACARPCTPACQRRQRRRAIIGSRACATNIIITWQLQITLIILCTPQANPDADRSRTAREGSSCTSLSEAWRPRKPPGRGGKALPPPPPPPPPPRAARGVAPSECARARHAVGGRNDSMGDACADGGSGGVAGLAAAAAGVDSARNAPLLADRRRGGRVAVAASVAAAGVSR